MWLDFENPVTLLIISGPVPAVHSFPQQKDVEASAQATTYSPGIQPDEENDLLIEATGHRQDDLGMLVDFALTYIETVKSMIVYHCCLKRPEVFTAAWMLGFICASSSPLSPCPLSLEGLRHQSAPPVGFWLMPWQAATPPLATERCSSFCDGGLEQAPSHSVSLSLKGDGSWNPSSTFGSVRQTPKNNPIQLNHWQPGSGFTPQQTIVSVWDPVRGNKQSDVNLVFHVICSSQLEGKIKSNNNSSRAGWRYIWYTWRTKPARMCFQKKRKEKKFKTILFFSNCSLSDWNPIWVFNPLTPMVPIHSYQHTLEYHC